MAGVADHSAGVLGGGDLRELRGLGRVLFMAADAQGGHIGQLGSDGAGVVGVLGEGSVAGLAGDVGVLAFGAGLYLVIVAYGALLLSGVSDRTTFDEVEGAGAVVAVLSEACGDDGAAERDEQRKSYENNDCGSDEVPGILKELTHLAAQCAIR
jgi:hypothetical protein